MARELPEGPWDTSRDDIITWASRNGWQPETLKTVRSTLANFYGWGQAAGHATTNPAATMPKVRVPRPSPRPAPDDVIREALRTASLRVRLMIMLAAICGLRRAEIARVNSCDLGDDNQLRVDGKGGVERYVPVPASLAGLLREQPPGWLFPSGAAFGPGHLTPQYTGKLMSRAIPGKWTAHTLRHAAATAWHDAGLDIQELSELLGHESVRTTQRYVRVRRKRLVDGVTLAARRL